MTAYRSPFHLIHAEACSCNSNIEKGCRWLPCPNNTNDFLVRTSLFCAAVHATTNALQRIPHTLMSYFKQATNPVCCHIHYASHTQYTSKTPSPNNSITKSWQFLGCPQIWPNSPLFTTPSRVIGWLSCLRQLLGEEESCLFSVRVVLQSCQSR